MPTRTLLDRVRRVYVDPMSQERESVAQPDEPADDATELLRDYIGSCSNWGRWGPDDELGALNLVGPDQVRRAAGLVRAGRPISLTLPYDQNGPQAGGGYRPNPLLLVTATGTDHASGQRDLRGFGYSDDIVFMPTQCGTQWDSLSHIFWQGRMYNGRPAESVTSSGAAQNGIENFTGRIVMRGVLLDAARHRGVTSLQPGDAIGPDEVDAILAANGIAVDPGDAVIVRPGFMAERRGAWGDFAGGDAPGLSLHMAPWLRDHQVAAVVTDTWGIEVRPNEIDYFQPLHLVSLVHGGLAFGEMFDLDLLAEDCAADGVYEFMFVASPLPITGASGAPVSGLAIK